MFVHRKIQYAACSLFVWAAAWSCIIWCKYFVFVSEVLLTTKLGVRGKSTLMREQKQSKKGTSKRQKEKTASISTEYNSRILCSMVYGVCIIYTQK